MDADRKRSNFEKDMDDMLFGGGPKPVRRGQKPVEQVKAPEQPVKNIPTKPAVQPQQPNKSIDNSRSTNVQVSASTTITKTRVTEEKKAPGQSTNNIASTKSIGLVSKINNFVNPEP